MLTKKQIEAKGYKVTFTNGQGAGGQKRNRTLSVAVVTYTRGDQTTVTQRCDETRNANKNMNIAYEAIETILNEALTNLYDYNLNELRKEALAKGTIRTYDFKRKVAKDHRSGKEVPLKKLLNGDIDSMK